MHRTAAALGIPAAWIDLRHDCTHGALPPLNRLRTATTDALSYLWQNYWENLEDNGTSNTLINELELPVKPAEHVEIFTEYVKRRAEEMKNKTSAVKVCSVFGKFHSTLPG